MGHTLRLPDGFEFPEEVNGWQFDPGPYNGNAWFSEDRETSVVVFAMLDRASVDVIDERISGSESQQRIAEADFETGDATAADPWAAEREAAAAMVEEAVTWMEANRPSDWAHPDVNEAVFDTPSGYELADYSLGTRSTTVYYQRTDAGPKRRLAGAGRPDEYTPETCPYLHVHVWNGSGNATVSLAPWRHAHGPDSKHPEVEPVVEPPEACGLDVAVAMARQYSREHVDASPEPSVTGQTDLQQFSESRP